MKAVIKKELLFDLQEAIKILEQKEDKDLEELKVLSNHAIEDVAAHKDLDIISMTVLLYSLYKIVGSLARENYNLFLSNLKKAESFLREGNLAKYNSMMKSLFTLVQKNNAQVREHLQDVMQAARIKKGTALLEKGLSIGQAAGLMGLSNWDLQQYAAKTVVLSQHEEGMPAVQRLQKALLLFEVR